MKRPPTMTQVILKTSAITLFIAFVASAYGLTLFGLAFPRVMGDLSVRLGAHNAAGMYYERVYKRTGDPKDLYLTLDQYIIAENHRKVIVFADKFFNHEEYERIIAEVNESGLGIAQNDIECVEWANERNRIKCRYTIALLQTNQKPLAEEKLLAWYTKEPDITQPNHAYFLSSWNEEINQAFEVYIKHFEDVDNIFAKDFLKVARLYGFE